MLNNLIKKKSLTLLGLNSGTSVDSVDMAVLKISRKNNRPQISYLTGCEYKFSTQLKDAVLRVADNPKATIDEMLELDIKLGDFFGRKADLFIKKLSAKKIKIDLIASHGQTIRHLPNRYKLHQKNQSATIQLGAPAQIANLTGKHIIADFRQADIALGGEGAPITTAAMANLFNDGKQKLIINIGGMSNYFLLPGNKRKNIEAADCGPGNVLIDLLMKKLYNKKYDKNGKTASSGSISKRLLSLLMGYSYSLGHNKSTGREDYGIKLVNEIIRLGKKLKLGQADLIAGTTEFTALMIAASVNKLVKKDENIKKLYLTGGGRKNIFLNKRLQHHLNQMKVENIDSLGLNGDYVEAAAYAVLGEAAIRSQSLGQKYKQAKPVLGTITQPPIRAK